MRQSLPDSWQAGASGGGEGQGGGEEMNYGVHPPLTPPIEGWELTHLK